MRVWDSLAQARSYADHVRVSSSASSRVPLLWYRSSGRPNRVSALQRMRAAVGPTVPVCVDTRMPSDAQVDDVRVFRCNKVSVT